MYFERTSSKQQPPARVRSLSRDAATIAKDATRVLSLSQHDVVASGCGVDELAAIDGTSWAWPVGEERRDALARARSMVAGASRKCAAREHTRR